MSERERRRRLRAAEARRERLERHKYDQWFLEDLRRRLQSVVGATDFYNAISPIRLVDIG